MINTIFLPTGLSLLGLVWLSLTPPLPSHFTSTALKIVTYFCDAELCVLLHCTDRRYSDAKMSSAFVSFYTLCIMGSDIDITWEFDGQP